jgi:hypothetical protein
MENFDSQVEAECLEVADSTRRVSIRAESRWHESDGEAENECDRKLDELERKAISDARNDGGRYSTGVLSAYEFSYDRTRDLVKCARRKTLYFDYPDKMQEDEQVEELTWEAYQELLNEGQIKGLAQNPSIDVSGTLRALLKPKVPQTENFTLHVPSIGGGPATRSTVAAPLTSITFQNLNIISSNLVLDNNAVPVGLPIKDQTWVYPYSNCTPAEQRHERDITYTVVRGLTITFSKTITSETRIAGTLTFSFGGGEASHTRNVSITNTRTISEERSETIRESYPFVFPANMICEAKLTIQHFEARRNFQGTIVVEGMAVLKYGKGMVIKNVPLSRLLNEQERTIFVSGYHGNLDYKVVPITITSKPCTG